MNKERNRVNGRAVRRSILFERAAVKVLSFVSRFGVVSFASWGARALAISHLPSTCIPRIVSTWNPVEINDWPPRERPALIWLARSRGRGERCGPRLRAPIRARSQIRRRQRLRGRISISPADAFTARILRAWNGNGARCEHGIGGGRTARTEARFIAVNAWKSPLRKSNENSSSPRLAFRVVSRRISHVNVKLATWESLPPFSGCTTRGKNNAGHNTE